MKRVPELRGLNDFRGKAILAMVPRALRALIVEDSRDDADLLIRELTRAGFEVTHRRVDTEDTFREALKETWEAVLCDYTLPSFSAPRALAVLKSLKLDLPFLIVSGAVGE